MNPTHEAAQVVIVERATIYPPGQDPIEIEGARVLGHGATGAAPFVVVATDDGAQRIIVGWPYEIVQRPSTIAAPVRRPGVIT